MKQLGVFYETTEFKMFVEKMYFLWKKLPDKIQFEQPFHILEYADEPLSWGDERQAKELCEKALKYYEEY